MREVNQYENERHQANERMEESHRRIKRLEREVEDCKVNLIQNAFNFW
jgi:queuine/archaeosine tRNA-ribosyltransferase